MAQQADMKILFESVGSLKSLLATQLIQVRIQNLTI